MLTRAECDEIPRFIDQLIEEINEVIKDFNGSVEPGISELAEEFDKLYIKLKAYLPTMEQCMRYAPRGFKESLDEHLGYFYRISQMEVVVKSEI